MQCLTLNYALDLELTLSNMRTVHCLIILNICAEFLVNPTRGSKDIEQTRDTVMQCLTLIYDHDLELTLVKRMHCKATHHT